MSALFAAMQAEFARVFAPIYLDGTLHKVVRTENDAGGGAVADIDYPIKGMIDLCTEGMRREPGYTASDVQIIILQTDFGAEPTTDDALTLRGQRWAVASVEQDPVQAGWVIRATPA